MPADVRYLDLPFSAFGLRSGAMPGLYSAALFTLNGEYIHGQQTLPRYQA